MSIYIFLLFLIEENSSYQELNEKKCYYSVLQCDRILKSRKYIQLHCTRNL